MRYRVVVTHQVRETYLVDAETRETAWAAIEHPLRCEDEEQVRLVRTDHGPRAVWSISRDVEDAPATLFEHGNCATCGDTMAECSRQAGRCCHYCDHTTPL